MIEDSVLTSEHISIQNTPGRTDGFIALLREVFLNLENELGDPASVALKLVLDGETTVFEWISTENPPKLEPYMEKMAITKKIDVYISMCCERNRLFEYQSRMNKTMQQDDLFDVCKHVTMVETRHLTSLAVCGLYRGAFINDDVPFTSGESDVLHITAWNNSTQRAQFVFTAENEEKAREVAEDVEERLDVDLTFDEGNLRIENVYLANYEEICVYLKLLGDLNALSEETSLTGAMSPENDDVFALLRFVEQGSEIILQTAVAEY